MLRNSSWTFMLLLKHISGRCRNHLPAQTKHQVHQRFAGEAGRGYVGSDLSEQLRILEVHRPAGRGKSVVVERILEVVAELQVDTLRDAEVLLHRDHRVVRRRSGQDVTSRIAWREWRRRRERGDVAGWQGAARIGRGRTAGRSDHCVLARLIEAVGTDVVAQSE